MKVKVVLIIILFVICGFFIMPSLSLTAASSSTNEQISIINHHCYPNPFNNNNEITKIRFNIKSEKTYNNITPVIVIYDYNSKRVWTKRLQTLSLIPGNNDMEVNWGGENDRGERVSNGLYYAKIIVEGPNTKIAVVKIIVK